jgi:hypothetical protein
VKVHPPLPSPACHGETPSFAHPIDHTPCCQGKGSSNSSSNSPIAIPHLTKTVPLHVCQRGQKWPLQLSTQATSCTPPPPQPPPATHQPLILPPPPLKQCCNQACTACGHSPAANLVSQHNARVTTADNLASCVRDRKEAQQANAKVWWCIAQRIISGKSTKSTKG